MNKNIIFSAIFLIVGLAGGLFLAQKYEPIPSNQNEEIDSDETINQVDSIENTESGVATNKLFEFMNSFRADLVSSSPLSESSAIQISKTNLKLGLLIVSYRTSPESNSYAIYDYKNNLFYKDIGYLNLGDIYSPVHLINEDNVLMSEGVHSEGRKTKNPLSIKNFRNNTTKVLPIEVEMQDYKLDINTDTNNNLIISTTQNGTTKEYLLNYKTLQVTKIK